MRAGSNSRLYRRVTEQAAERDRNWPIIDAVKRVAAEVGAIPTQMALIWLLDRPSVTEPICGARTLA